jgi:uncharacterized protein (TIGR03000 family)
MYRFALTFLAGTAGCLLVSALWAQPGSITVPPDRAILIVRLPADATLTVGDQVSTQTGPARTFTTPQLQAGFTYSYELVARWQENGKQLTSRKTLTFQPGQAALVDLMQGQPDAPVAAKQPHVPAKKGDLKAAPPKSRSFLFTYAGSVTGLEPGETARVWLPVATTNGQQEVTMQSQRLPGPTQMTKDKEYGTPILYFEGKADAKGEVPFQVVYKVARRETRTDTQGSLHLQPAPGERVARYLQPDAKVPIVGKPLEVLQERLKGAALPMDQFAAAKKMYDVVNQHMTYKKVGKGWGHGDVLWACDSRYGNCTDFHSLFISMARGNKIPAKIEMGFPLPPARGSGSIPGYHCWAWFMPAEKGWIPVDISEANQHPDQAEYYFGNLSENRISFSVGRDIELEPRQKGPPVNFLIYPYVEVGGMPYPADRVQRHFAYSDVPVQGP